MTIQNLLNSGIPANAEIVVGSYETGQWKEFFFDDGRIVALQDGDGDGGEAGFPDERSFRKMAGGNSDSIPCRWDNGRVCVILIAKEE